MRGDCFQLCCSTYCLLKTEFHPAPTSCILNSNSLRNAYIWQPKKVFMNKHAYVFPVQGSQFSGMGKTLYDVLKLPNNLFEQANDIIRFRISDIMFNGSDEDLKQTDVTQPAVFLHSVIRFRHYRCATSGYGGRALAWRIFSLGSCNQTFRFEEAFTARQHSGQSHAKSLRNPTFCHGSSIGNGRWKSGSHM